MSYGTPNTATSASILSQSVQIGCFPKLQCPTKGRLRRPLSYACDDIVCSLSFELVDPRHFAHITTYNLHGFSRRCNCAAERRPRWIPEYQPRRQRNAKRFDDSRSSRSARAGEFVQAVPAGGV